MLISELGFYDLMKIISEIVQSTDANGLKIFLSTTVKVCILQTILLFGSFKIEIELLLKMLSDFTIFKTYMKLRLHRVMKLPESLEVLNFYLFLIDEIHFHKEDYLQSC